MTGGTPIVDRLLDDAEEGLLLGQSDAYTEATFGESDLREAVALIRGRPDAGAFHLLMALRRASPGAYSEIPAEARAAVLTDSLRRQRKLNDWGWIEPSGGHDGPAAQALLETGTAAVRLLAPLLEDDSTARLIGSEIATVARQYGYRRKDFAYRYLCKLLGREPTFEPQPAERDAAIAALQRELG